MTRNQPNNFSSSKQTSLVAPPPRVEVAAAAATEGGLKGLVARAAPRAEATGTVKVVATVAMPDEVVQLALVVAAAAEREAHAATAAVARCGMPRFETLLLPSRPWWG